MMTPMAHVRWRLRVAAQRLSQKRWWVGVRAVALLGALSVCVGGCGEIPSDAVVRVNGSSIATATLRHWMLIAASSSTNPSSAAGATLPQPPRYRACIAGLEASAPKPAKGQRLPSHSQLKAECAQQYTALKNEALSYLISAEWLLQEAAAQGVKVSDNEVHSEFIKVRKESFAGSGALERFLHTSNFSVSDLLLRIKLETLSQRLERKVLAGGRVTTAAIARYYRENKPRFGVPEKRDVRIVLSKTAAQANAALRRIRSGESFASVARSVSIDPTSRADDGLLKEVVKGEEEAALSQAIFAAKAHVLGGPVKTPFGYYVYEVEAIVPGSQQSLAQATPTIKRELQSSEQQRRFESFKQGYQKRWKARTECRAGYVVSQCRQYKAKGSRLAPGSGE
jgi:foldase protein PrsA